MRYTYTIKFNDSVRCSFGNGRAFSLYSKGGNLHVRNTWKREPVVMEKVNGDFGVLFGCNVIEVERLENGIVVKSNIRIKYLHIDNGSIIETPATDADLEEAALSAREDWTAVQCKEDWAMVTA
jgi:hypothetical protein